MLLRKTAILMIGLCMIVGMTQAAIADEWTFMVYLDGDVENIDLYDFCYHLTEYVETLPPGGGGSSGGGSCFISTTDFGL